MLGRPFHGLEGNRARGLTSYHVLHLLLEFISTRGGLVGGLFHEKGEVDDVADGVPRPVGTAEYEDGANTAPRDMSKK